MLNGKTLNPAINHDHSESLRALLSQVCAPFVQGMLNAVEQLVEQEVERQVKQHRQQDCQVPVMNWPPRRLSREQQHQPQHCFGNPDGVNFGAMFDAQANQNVGEADSMKLANVTSVPLPEESSEDEAEADGEQRGRFQALFGGKVPPSGSRSSSRSGRSNASSDPKPPGFAGIPMMSHAQAQAATAPEGDPLYLQWSSQGQTGGERPSLTPTVSPVAPRILPGGNQGQGKPMDGGQGQSPESAGQAKSAVVCRHWKSKGWCRMGTECKFAHPEHKCGAGISSKKEKDKGSIPGTTLTKPEAAGQSQVRQSKGKKSKSKEEVMMGSPALTPGLVHNPGPNPS